MTERDLSTLLRDHLADEPPTRLGAADAIGTGRRQTARLRVLAGGAGILAVATVAVLGASGALDRGDDTPVAQEAPAPVLRTGPLDEVMEAVATDALTPYVGALGAPRWSVNDLDGRPVAVGDPTAQFYLLDYRPADTPQVNLTVGGFAEVDRENYPFEGTCTSGLARGTLAACTQTTLDDGSLLTISTGPISRIGGDAPRLLTVAEVEGRDPSTFAWARVVSVDSVDEISTRASEYVRGADVDTVHWQVPVDVLQELALDPSLLAADVAHAPMPLFTDE